MNWFENRPLFGQTIAVTRTRQQASDLAQQLEELGARVIEAPTIELVPPSDWAAVDQSLHAAAQFDWIIFTSQNGVAFTKQRLLDLHLDARAFGQARIAAIGDATAAAIRQHLCLNVDLCPTSFVAEALADELLRQNQIQGKRFLLLRADIARPILREKLQQNGAADVRDVPIYHTRVADSLPPTLLEALAEKHVHWITFTSSSTARNFVTLLGSDYAARLRDVKIASIGPITTATLRELQIPVTVQAQQFNLPGLIDAIVAATKAAERSESAPAETASAPDATA
jgi:uroporphyrinogen III methyltransferase/synthase